MKAMSENCEPGQCRIQMFDLNGKDTGATGVPGMNPADGFLIRVADNHRTWHILLDAGKKGQGTAVIVPWLRKMGITRLDAIILSHFHYDHFGGMIDLLVDSELEVEEIIYAPIGEELIERGDAGELNSSLWQECRLAMEGSGCRLTALDGRHLGHRFAFGDKLGLTVLAVPDALAWADEPVVNLNNLNVILLLDYGRFTALFPGDCGAAQTAALLEPGCRERIANICLLKAAHHGGDESTTPELIELCNPRLVWIPCNETVVEHRPSFVENLHRFTSRGARVVRGDWDYDAELTTDGVMVVCNTHGYGNMKSTYSFKITGDHE
ncbi:MBL fold metallo-hydrolase [Paenibacillus sp. J5C_2022]|uniref:ComEC/Rec2 family competence protein n=1 Tax=Paenibacillus sp. J5C2022 TaxID=2977129 RepID=UPI0021D135C6|nr:MBL fold metallo-hydrolase [Paenibacillus sp. J5C2022]MCU6709699.1 MBL fold metallo-hydrolase [Paenibacillus sp. J5C2022]